MKLSHVTCVTMALALSMFAAGAAAQYPTKPVLIIVPFAVGGGADIVTRIVAQQMSKNTGKSFVVENRGGAGGRIGTAAVVKAAPDGYTIAFVDKAYAMMRALYGANLGWDSASDPIAVTMLAHFPFLVVVTSKIKVTSLKGFIELAKASPGKLNYGSAGIGSSNHIMAELFKREAHVDLTHVPYKSMGESITGVLNGSIDMMIVSPTAVAPYLSTGSLVPLAVASAKRSPALPDVQSVVEAGLPGFMAENWFGLVAPKDTPKAIVDWLQKEASRALSSADVKGLLAKQGLEPSGMTPEEFGTVIRDDTRRLSEVIRAAGIKGE